MKEGYVTQPPLGRLTRMLANIIESGLSVDCGIHGNRGSGKSYCALKLCEKLSGYFNTPFTKENIHFSAKSFLERMDELTADKKAHEVPAGICHLIDEAGTSNVASSSLSWDSKIQSLSEELETIRVYRMGIFMTTPIQTNIVKKARQNLSASMVALKPLIPQRQDLNKPTSNILKTLGYSRWRFYLKEEVQVKGKYVSMKYRPKGIDEHGETIVLDSIRVGLPSKKILKPYDEAKSEFNIKNRARNLDKIRRKEEKAAGITDNTKKRVYVGEDEGTYCRRRGCSTETYKRWKKLGEIPKPLTHTTGGKCI